MSPQNVNSPLVLGYIIAVIYLTFASVYITQLILKMQQKRRDMKILKNATEARRDFS